MRRKLKNLFKVGIKFKQEFRRQIRLLIVFTLGFTIAFTWRQTAFDLSQSFVLWITKIENSNTATILTSTFITLISIILIYFTSHMLQGPQNNNSNGY